MALLRARFAVWCGVAWAKAAKPVRWAQAELVQRVFAADLKVEGEAQQPRSVGELTADAQGEPQQVGHLAVVAQRQLRREDRARAGGIGEAADGGPGQSGHGVTVDARWVV